MIEPSNVQRPAATTAGDFDGIQVSTAPIPRWWARLFGAAMLVATSYLFLSFAWPDWASARLEYEREEAAEVERQFAEIGRLEPDYATISGFFNDPDKAKWLSVGMGIFNVHCATCHARGGMGLSGPNLTDDSYLIIKKLTDIPALLVKGSVAAGMPAWEGRLTKNEMVLVSAYVASLRGQNLEGKEVQGDVIPSWEEAGR